MARVWRWLIASVAGVAAFAGTWAACQGLLRLEQDASTAWAGLATAVVMTPLAAWASLGGPPHRRHDPREP